MLACAGESSTHYNIYMGKEINPILPYLPSRGWKSMLVRVTVHVDITAANTGAMYIPTVFVETVLLRKDVGCTLYYHSYATASYYPCLAMRTFCTTVPT